MRTATGNVTLALGSLLVELKVDGKSEKILFCAINELEHELILGMDFCSLIDVDVRIGRGLWCVHPGEWCIDYRVVNARTVRDAYPAASVDTVRPEIYFENRP